jgi:hypothetical protein
LFATPRLFAKDTADTRKINIKPLTFDKDSFFEEKAEREYAIDFVSVIELGIAQGQKDPNLIKKVDKLCRVELKRSPSNPYLEAELGLLYSHLEKYSRAEPLFKKVMRSKDWDIMTPSFKQSVLETYLSQLVTQKRIKEASVIREQLIVFLSSKK